MTQLIRGGISSSTMLALKKKRMMKIWGRMPKTTTTSIRASLEA